MILSDYSILKFVKEKKLIIEPFDKRAVQPASFDCRLGDHFLFLEDRQMTSLSLNKEALYKEYRQDKITIPPRSFLLATTKEYFSIPNNVTAFVEGRSSIGRMGLFVENAGWVDPGFKGNITLELYNANSLPIEVEAGRRICQLVFCKMDQKSERPYQGKYLGQKGSTGSLIFKDDEVS